MFEFCLSLIVVTLLAYPLGQYLASIMQNRKMKIDVVFYWIEKPIYVVLGTNPKQGMNVKTYTFSFVMSCAVIGLLTCYLRILVAKLKAKLNDNAFQPKYIVTEPGLGLRFLSH